MFETWRDITIFIVAVIIAGVTLFNAFTKVRETGRPSQKIPKGTETPTPTSAPQRDLKQSLDELERKLLRLQADAARAAEEISLLRKQVKQIQGLEERVERLERSRAGKKQKQSAVNFFRRAHAAESTQKPTDEGLTDPNENLVLREYIRPAIYTILAFLLLLSAIVGLATGDAPRKKTAEEWTKTLMTFFIGVISGKA